MDFVIRPIGFVRSPLTSRRDCPKQYTENAPAARIEVLPEFAPALDTLREGQDVLVLTWLHQSERSYLQVHPRGDASLPKKGVFNTRSPDRPNPLGLHRARITGIEGATLALDALEVLDGTPVADIKSVGPEDRGDENWGSVVGAQAGADMSRVCAEAHALGLLPGLSGNASLRLDHVVIITRAGRAKGRLRPGDLTSLDLADGRILGPGRPSTEAALHLAVYAGQPEAKAVLHSHPPRLLALSLARGGPDPNLPLYEAAVAMEQVAVVPALAPGSAELAQAVGRAARTHQAVFMTHHGLVVWGRTLDQALALTEELDALAGIRLLADAAGK